MASSTALSGVCIKESIFLSQIDIDNDLPYETTIMIMKTFNTNIFSYEKRYRWHFFNVVDSHFPMQKLSITIFLIKNLIDNNFSYEKVIDNNFSY